MIGYYALGRDKFSTKTILINNFSSERVDSKDLMGDEGSGYWAPGGKKWLFKQIIFFGWESGETVL